MQLFEGGQKVTLSKKLQLFAIFSFNINTLLKDAYIYRSRVSYHFELVAYRATGKLRCCSLTRLSYVRPPPKPTTWRGRHWLQPTGGEDAGGGMSGGIAFPANQKLKANLQRLKQRQRRLSHKDKGSHRRTLAKTSLAKLHARITVSVRRYSMKALPTLRGGTVAVIARFAPPPSSKMRATSRHAARPADDGMRARLRSQCRQRLSVT